MSRSRHEFLVSFHCEITGLLAKLHKERCYGGSSRNRLCFAVNLDFNIQLKRFLHRVHTNQCRETDGRRQAVAEVTEVITVHVLMRMALPRSRFAAVPAFECRPETFRRSRMSSRYRREERQCRRLKISRIWFFVRNCRVRVRETRISIRACYHVDNILGPEDKCRR